MKKRTLRLKKRPPLRTPDVPLESKHLRLYGIPLAEIQARWKANDQG